ncbi:MAG: hypothetical protein AB7G21_12965 [Dehalococcoidia bacterium]
MPIAPSVAPPVVRRSARLLVAGLVFLVVACADPRAEAPGTVTPRAGGATGAAAGSASATAAPATRYIANTDGQGVRLRADCRDDAPAPDGAGAARGLPERTEVAVDTVGSGPCAGWTRVSGGAAVSWVRDGYLVAALPATGGGAASAAVTGVASSSAPPPSTAGVVANATPPPSSFAFTATGGARVTLAEIDGTATLWGGPTGFTYLGLLSSTPLPDSVCNTTGRYGSPSGAESVRNPSSAYGSLGADTSAYNPAATTPPVIKYKNATVAQLTRAASGRGAVDPDAFLNALCR